MSQVQANQGEYSRKSGVYTLVHEHFTPATPHWGTRRA